MDWCLCPETHYSYFPLKIMTGNKIASYNRTSNTLMPQYRFHARLISCSLTWRINPNMKIKAFMHTAANVFFIIWIIAKQATKTLNKLWANLQKPRQYLQEIFRDTTLLPPEYLQTNGSCVREDKTRSLNTGCIKKMIHSYKVFFKYTRSKLYCQKLNHLQE